MSSTAEHATGTLRPDRALTPEGDVLRQAVTGQPSNPQAWSRSLRGGLLCSWARHHRLLPDVALICEAAQRARLGSIEDLAPLLKERDRALATTAQRTLAAVAVVDELGRRMPVALAKGAHFVELMGPTGAPPRTMGDVDVYIYERDLEKAVAICDSHGVRSTVTGRRLELYRRDRGQLALEGAGTSIDLHWWVNNNPLHRLASRFSVSTLLEDGEERVWNGARVTFPRLTDAVLLNAIYMTYENWGQVLRMYVDHARLLDRADPELLVARSRDLELTNLLRESVERTERVVGRRFASCLRESASRRSWPVVGMVRTAGPGFGAPSLATRSAEWSIAARFRPGRYVVRVVETLRVLASCDEKRRRALLPRLLWPRRNLRRSLYLGQPKLSFVALHPTSIALASLLLPSLLALRRLTDLRAGTTRAESPTP